MGVVNGCSRPGDGILKINALRRAVGVLLIFGLPLWAAPGAVLQVSGPVHVNGKLTERSALLLDSDAVQTFSSPAAITQPGSHVLIGTNSLVSYSPSGIKLSSGSALVTATVPFSVRAEHVVVQPASAKARFAVRETPCNIQIAALEGGISVNDGSKNLLLDSGKSLSFPLLKSATEAAAKTDVDPDCEPATEGGAPQTRPQNANGNLALFAGSSAGSALLVLWLSDRNQIPISPSGP